MIKRLLPATAVVASLLMLGHQARATPVDLELGIVIDVSGSVDTSEFELQRDGYAAAFDSAPVKSFVDDLVAGGSNGIAASVWYFGTNADGPSVGLRIPWTLLGSGTDVEAFAASISGLAAPPTLGDPFIATNIADGIHEAANSMLGNGFDGDRLALDVSGDGKQNVTLAGTGCVPGPGCDTFLQTERDAAEAASITVNGLAIIDDFSDLLTYYGDNVISSDGFALGTTFADFQTSVQAKVVREITGRQDPEPATLGLLWAGIAGLAFAVRRRRQAVS